MESAETPAEGQPAEAPPQDKMRVKVGGATLVLPGNASEEAVQAAIKNYLGSPEFDAQVDRDTGAPARVRTIVGSAAPQDRLANLRKFYPDAIEHGDENFIFTDPGTGKPTLFNPEGLDVGDVFGAAKEIATATGATLGGVFGAGGGLVVGAPGGPPGMLAGGASGASIGAGLGAAAGSQLFDAAMSVAIPVDTRTPLQRVLEPSTEFFAAATGERVGQLVGASAKRALGGGRDAAGRLVQSFRNLRIEPRAGAVSGSRTVASLEHALDSSPLAADVMKDSAERVLRETSEAADRVAQGFGRARSAQGAGEVIRQAAADAGERFGFTKERAYTQAFDLVGADTPVAVASVTSLRETMEAELAQAPRSLKPALDKAIRMATMLEEDATDGLTFSAMRQVRTMIGKDLDDPILAGSTSAQNAALKRLYGALTEDMSDAAKIAGPEAAHRLEVADRFTRAFMRTAGQTLNKIGKTETDEAAFKFAMRGAQDGGTALTRMRRQFAPEEWDTVAATVLQRMGRATPGAQDATGEAFSVNTFLTNWSKLAPESKAALFGGKRYKDLAPALDDLVEVVGSLKGAQKLMNTSNTARAMIGWMSIQAAGGALAALAAGGDGTQSVGAGALAGVIAPRMAAKLITSPKFVRWLTTPVQEVSGIAAHIGRLSAIAAEEDIQEEVAAFLGALRSAPGLAGSSNEGQEGK